jgi:hypothetical protein
MKKSFIFLFLILSLAGFYGCATTAPTAEFRKPIADTHLLCANDDATIKLTTADGVPLQENGRQRLAELITNAINLKKAKAQCSTNDKRSFILNSTITEYDEGNAFARFMLAGLGQIHIDGDFSLFLTTSEKQSVAEFTLRKTFAWGGMHGATTDIKDVEPAFAQGVADAIVVEGSEKKDSPPANQKDKSKTPEGK